MVINDYEDFIVHLARLVRPKLFVKLGLFNCALFNRVVPYAEKSIGVDVQPEAASYMKKSRDTRFVKGTTQDFAKELEVNPLQINMLFIDADPSKVAVKQTFQEFFPFIAPRGLILIHDSQLENAEMLKPVGRDTQPYEFMSIPVSQGLTICRKRQEQVAW